MAGPFRPPPGRSNPQGTAVHAKSQTRVQARHSGIHFGRIRLRLLFHWGLTPIALKPSAITQQPLVVGTRAAVAPKTAPSGTTERRRLQQRTSELLGEKAADVASVLWMPFLGSGLVFGGR